MQVQEIAHSLVGLGSLAALRGRHEEALGLFERALDRLRAIGSAATDEARLGLARALAARGRVKAAERMMTELAEEHRAAGRPGWWARAEAERARLAAERAKFDEVQEALVSCAEGLNAVHLNDVAVSAAASRVAELGRAAGDDAVVALAARIAEVTSAEYPSGRVPVLG
jgi:tetratricopeptide (TPR) repeat protein